MADLESILALLVVVVALATLARRIGIPAPIFMVLGGIGIGFLPGLPAASLAPNVVFFIFLPPLLYVAAVFAPLRDYRANASAIGMLAVGLVLVTAGVVAFVAHAILPTLGWAEAFTLGAIVAPPDAVAATSILQRIGVPRRIVAILEGESLLNDATALVAYRLALASAASGRFAAGDALLNFVLVGLGGVVVGVVVGGLAVALRRRLTDTPVSITVSILTPFIAYLSAEQLGSSGVLATVTAGLYVGRHLALLSSEERITGGAVWQTMSFILNGLLFTLVGLQLPAVVRGLDGPALTDAITLGLIIAVTGILVRFVWVFPTTYLTQLVRRRPISEPGSSWRDLTVVSWAGMRGAVSLAAALGLPLQLGAHPFAQRDLFVFVTFCVIVVTLIGQGLTLDVLTRALGIVAPEDAGRDEMRARAAVAESALALLPEMRRRWPGHAELIDRLHAEYEHRVLHAEEHSGSEIGAAEGESLEHRQMRQELIDAERAAAAEMHGRAAISDEVYRRLIRDLDLDELRSG